ncbi:nitroreductase [Microbacterium terrae]|uniref:Putative NAD(P)H nitroreductase n=1 Tax=Microbacterium terrae TaxID=69369 RepID=A0A0M2HCW8_9MICO|nr:nitroreductase family protein [Microbacterium terrae]KJL42059.1 putative NAD(P)H nitroreductase YdjA [Microbacterium terrae]MBP1076678.1 nitroreductase [Microbacterium terrae]GLJ97506.1 NAD(P)H nitroreductase [Microbacterium terrae]
MTGALEAMLDRRSWSKFTDDAPSHHELLDLIAGAGRVADHSSLKPWRLIELRGDDRRRLGRAIGRAEGDSGVYSKPLRAPLLIAIVASYKKSKVPRWEQEAVASGVAHALSLVLDEAGYAVFWRTGSYTRAKAVAKAHGLGKNEELLGWLYVGGKPARSRALRRKTIDPTRFLSPMPGRHSGGGEKAKGKKSKK